MEEEKLEKRERNFENLRETYRREKKAYEGAERHTLYMLV